MNCDSLKTKAEIEIEKLEKKYEKKLIVDQNLTRKLVSFQANKKEPGYRWYKFKEGFSNELIKYYLDSLEIKKGSKVLDPFAGSGSTLFTSWAKGLDSFGIELLPIGCEVVEARQYANGKSRKKIVETFDEWIKTKPWTKEKKRQSINYIRITEGAFPKETERQMEQYLFLANSQPKIVSKMLIFALLCVLEETSYTRKDGQYLRWDSRSNRNIKSSFNKGPIREFNEAIVQKLTEIRDDILEISKSIAVNNHNAKIELASGSILSELPKLKTNDFDFLMTSPPYCNRYDYTRTYALELNLLGVGEEKIRELRQAMLSCTVENKDKMDLNEKFSKKIFQEATKAFETQPTLKAILEYLDCTRLAGELNNPGIVRMVRNYFYELALVIFESGRVLKKDGWFVMVNDNVRYVGVTIPVDLILSEFAKKAGFEIEKISVLPRGKGNSSQQMGKYGRAEIRKCVYLWRKKS